MAAGLAREKGYDFFQSRALWPIRDSGKQVLGFGARRLFDDDRMPAKYINTPETVLYKKSHVLYGLDLARTAISKKSQAVVVEGYTDVMAAHLAGVDTAVASCGTAFGDDHARLLRRLMGDHDAFHGEVIFTFDGDAAGQAAALKVFAGDQNFVTQTYVAIEPTGLDPCDLRLQQGDAAVRELVARRLPLYQFVMSNMLAQHDLDRADGRLAALRAAAPLVASIRDTALVSGYVRELAGMLGMDMEEVRAEVMRRRPGPAAGPRAGRRSPSSRRPRRAGRPDPDAAPAGPAAGHGAGDDQADDPEPGAVPAGLGRGQRWPTSPIPRTRRSSPRWRRPATEGTPLDNATATPRRVGAPDLRGQPERGGPLAGRRAGGGAAAVSGRGRLPVRGGQHRQAAAAHRDAGDRRAQVAAAADQPGGGAQEVQPDVLRAGRCWRPERKELRTRSIGAAD